MEMAKLTALQFVSVHLLFSGPKTPGELRKGLRKLGVKRSLGSFSRLVRRLEWGQCLEVAYDKPEGGRRLRECRLAVTDIGVMNWNATREFYAGFSRPPAKLVPVQTEEGRLAHLPARVRKGIMKKRAMKELREGVEKLKRSRTGARKRGKGKRER
jgi:hypothetical protein